MKKLNFKTTYIGRLKPLDKGTYSRSEITDPNKKTTPKDTLRHRNFS